jgi:hypothetical protein
MKSLFMNGSGRKTIFAPVANYDHKIFCYISIRFLLARLATGRENKVDCITHIFQIVINFVNFRTNCKEKYIAPSTARDLAHNLHIRALMGKVDGESEDNGYFNGKYREEKYVFREREVFKDFVRLPQKSGAYWRGVHPERIIGFIPLISCMSGHLNAPCPLI